MLQELVHYLGQVGIFSAGLFRYDKRDMQKVGHVTVKALGLKATGRSTSDTMTLFKEMALWLISRRSQHVGSFKLTTLSSRIAWSVQGEATQYLPSHSAMPKISTTQIFGVFRDS